MKELIYRRAATGYKVDRSAEGISAANRTTGTKHAMTSLKPEQNAICYRQFRLDDGTIALGMGYMDLHGERNSLLGHLLYADEKEIVELLESYPSSSAYFTNFRKAYADNEALHQNAAEMEIPVKTFLEGRQGGIRIAVEILKRVFGTPDALASMFEALLDAASNNARMVIIFGPDEEPVMMAERGRQLIESLFACLPNVLVRRLGYISPASNDDGNAIFGVRYSKQRSVAPNMRNYVYSYNMNDSSFAAPPRANRAAEEYAGELARLVFASDAAAIARIRQLKQLLDDSGLYNASDVPRDLALRYRFYNGADKISLADWSALLDWHHSVISEAEKCEGDYSCSKFWNVVDEWIVRSAFTGIYEQTRVWKGTDPVYSARRVKELYEDGQRIFLLGWKQAESYREIFARRIGSEPLLDPSSEKLVYDELIKYISTQVKNSKESDFARRCLYWDSIEGWFRSEWNNGMLFKNRLAVDAVCRLYDLDNKLGSNYVQAYADGCIRSGTSLLGIIYSNFGRLSFERILEIDPDYVGDSMKRELGGQDPFGSPEAIGKFVQYRKLVEDNAKLVERYENICSGRLKWVLGQAKTDDLKMLFAELQESEGAAGIVAAYRQMDPRGNAREAIELRIVELANREGIYLTYPADRPLSHDLAELLDHRSGHPVWQQQLSVLEEAYKLSFAELSESAFDRCMEEGFGSRNDTRMQAKVKELLWGNIKDDFSAGMPDMHALLMALALHNSNGGAFNPAAMLEDCEKLGISRKKMLAYCRKNAVLTTNKGVGYVANMVQRADSGARDRAYDDWVQYPGDDHEFRTRGIVTTMFAGVPTAVAAVGIVLFGSGLGASVFGILKFVGLL